MTGSGSRFGVCPTGPLCLVLSLMLGGCVDVPERADPDAPGADEGPGPDRLMPPPDGRPPDAGDGSAMDVAVVDGGPADAEPDPGLDVALDMRPLDMAPDVPPLDMAPDVPPLDMAPDVPPPDMEPPPPSLMYSGCLRRAAAIAIDPQNLAPPCVQVAVGAPMPEPLSWRTGLALPDNRAVLVGGLSIVGGENVVSRRVDIYDPDSDTWTPGPPLPAGRWATAVSLVETADGLAIMVLGGAGDVQGARWNAVGDVLLWPVDSDEDWDEIGRLSGIGLGFTAAWSARDTVWLVGGLAAGRSPPTTDTTLWTPGEPPAQVRGLIQARYGHALAEYRGRPMVIGGAGEGQTALPSAELHNGTEWVRIGDDGLRRVYAAAAVTNRGDILVTGGRTHPLDYQVPDGGQQPTPLNTALRIEQPVGRDLGVTVEPPMHRARFAHGLAPLGEPSPYLMAIGGEDNGAQETLVEVHDARVSPAIWWPLVLTDDAAIDRGHHTTVGLPDGRIVVAGGVRGAGQGNPELLLNQTLVFRLSPDGEADPSDP